MYLEYSVISSNVIVLSMVILRDKVNIYMYPLKEVTLVLRTLPWCSCLECDP